MGISLSNVETLAYVVGAIAILVTVLASLTGALCRVRAADGGHAPG